MSKEGYFKQKNRKKLLFTGGGGAGSEALYRQLNKNYRVFFADADNEAKPYSIPSKYWHQIPFASSSNFIDELRDLCKNLDIDLLIPGVDEELIAVADAKDTFDCEILLPPLEFVKIHLDKYTSNKNLVRFGIPVPRSELPSQRKLITYPCIVKPRKGRGSRGVALIKSEKELNAHILLSHLNPEDIVLQELITGQEFTIMMLANKAGKLCAVVPIKVLLKRGITIRSETNYNKKVIETCTRIHMANPVSGYYNIQLFETKRGEIMPFEINPRISTTACLALASGVNFIEIYLQNNVNNDNNISDLAPFQNGLKMKRSWYNEFLGCELK